MAVFERKNWKMLHYLLILQCQRKGKACRRARQAKPAQRQPNTELGQPKPRTGQANTEPKIG